MTLHDTENAVKFESRKECRKWIAKRIVRFKLRMVKTLTITPGEFTYVPHKEQGKIICTLDEGFEESGTDEPLKNYAEPTKQDGEWLAVMKLQ